MDTITVRFKYADLETKHNFRRLKKYTIKIFYINSLQNNRQISTLQIQRFYTIKFPEREINTYCSRYTILTVNVVYGDENYYKKNHYTGAARTFT